MATHLNRGPVIGDSQVGVQHPQVKVERQGKAMRIDCGFFPETEHIRLGDWTGAPFQHLQRRPSKSQAGRTQC